MKSREGLPCSVWEGRKYGAKALLAIQGRRPSRSASEKKVEGGGGKYRPEKSKAIDGWQSTSLSRDWVVFFSALGFRESGGGGWGRGSFRNVRGNLKKKLRRALGVTSHNRWGARWGRRGESVVGGLGSGGKSQMLSKLND